jgi:hypothetical protein
VLGGDSLASGAIRHLTLESYSFPGLCTLTSPPGGSPSWLRPGSQAFPH